jgi:pimeloyl-ACP methyl ester carboxylesterase
MSKHFVLIHGAWHGGWCWQGVISALEAAGHTAVAPDMPGHAPGDDRSKVTFADYVDRVADTVAAQPVPVVLVGHSSAGFLLQSAAPRVTDKLEKLVFLNAFVLPDGLAQFDLVPPEAAEGMTAAAGASPDNCVPVIEPFVRDMLMVGETEDAILALLARLTPQPLILFTTKVSTGAFNAVDTPKVVVLGTNDASLPPGSFQQMAAGLGEHATIEFDGGHEALFTQPKVVAAKLIEAAG